MHIIVAHLDRVEVTARFSQPVVAGVSQFSLVGEYIWPHRSPVCGSVGRGAW
jgi:hypothetical protein